MGVFNFIKSDIGETIVSDFESEEIEQKVFEEIKEDVKEIRENYNLYFRDRLLGTIEYKLDDIFFIKINPGYYNGFSINIESKFKIEEMDKKIKSGLFNIEGIDVSNLTHDGIKLNVFFKYISEQIMPEYIDNDGVMTNVFTEMTDEEREELITKPIENEIRKYFTYLNYKIMEIGEAYGMYKLKSNGYFHVVEKITKEDILLLKRNYEIFKNESLESIPDFKNMSFRKVKLYVEEIMLKNYKEFIKALIAIEYNYELEDIPESEQSRLLDRVFNIYIDNDYVSQIINESFSEIISDVKNS